MSNDVAINENPVFITKQKPLTAAEVKDSVKLMQEVLQAVMRKGTHYDIIPGTDKNTLYKAGAEKILSTFRIAVMPEVLNLSTDTEIRYQVTCKGVHQPTGIVVGAGVGECSSAEEKYAWRAMVSEQEYVDAEEQNKRVKYYKNGGTSKQVRTNKSDVANTILKMAKKRSMVDLALTATAASDLFTQDLEDMPENLRPQHSGGNQPAGPRVAEGNTGKPATEKQIGMIRARAAAKQIDDTTLCKEMGIGNLEELTMGKVNDLLDWISGQ